MKQNNSILTHQGIQYLLMIFIFCMTMLAIPTVHATYYYGGHHRGHHGGYYSGYRHYSYPYSYRYNYGYRHYPLSYSYSYSRRHYDSNYTPQNKSTTYSDETSNKDTPDDRGWQLLSQNKPSEAFKVFAEQAGRKQSDGIPKVGYALSSAMQGDYDKATWAMRRAFRIAPDSLHYLDIEKVLQPGIKDLISEYDRHLNAEGNQSDAAFMVAALNYLLHDNKAAGKAIDYAIENEGDSSRSTENLHRLLKRDEQVSN